MKKAVIYLTINKVLPEMVLDERNEEIYSEELHVERQTVELAHWHEYKMLGGTSFNLRKEIEVNRVKCLLNVQIAYGVTELETPGTYKKIYFKANLEENELQSRAFSLKVPLGTSEFSFVLDGQKFSDAEKPNINMLEFEVQVDEV